MGRRRRRERWEGGGGGRGGKGGTEEVQMRKEGQRTLTDSCMTVRAALLTSSRAAIRSLSELALCRCPRASDTAIAFPNV